MLSAPPRSPGNKGPPPPRAGRDLRGQRGAERPDAGGGRRRPRAARFLRVSSPSALPGARARSAARGEGAPRGLGDSKMLLAPPAAQRAEKAAACALHPPRRWWRRGGAPPLPWLRALRPAHLRYSCRVGLGGGGEWQRGVGRHAESAHLLQFALGSCPLEYHIPGVQLSPEAAAFSRDPRGCLWGPLIYAVAGKRWREPKPVVAAVTCGAYLQAQVCSTDQGDCIWGRKVTP